MLDGFGDLGTRLVELVNGTTTELKRKRNLKHNILYIYPDYIDLIIAYIMFI